MKKEEIFVRIDNEEKRLRAIQILTDAGEVIWSDGTFFYESSKGSLMIDRTTNMWFLSIIECARIEITLDQLEQILTPNYAVQEVHLTIDEIRLQAEKLGFELVEKKRDVKIGDFGVFWDDEDEEKPYFSFFLSIEDGWFFDERGLSWQNFRHLTDDEKERITQSW